MIVEYVGNTYQPEDENVTATMVAEVLADEFPEFIALMAQENYINGYRKALEDVEMFNDKPES